MNFTVINSEMPTAIVIVLVLLALIWGLVFTCYIADVAWAVCVAHSSVNSIEEARCRRQALARHLRRNVFVVGDEEEKHEAVVERLI
ncbi:unnamed protein product [Caenorhabditis brenneri]